MRNERDASSVGSDAATAASPPSRRLLWFGLCAAGGLAFSAVLYAVSRPQQRNADRSRVAIDHAPPVPTQAQVERLCSHCHVFPQPDSMPRSTWGKHITEMSGRPGYGVGMSAVPRPAAITAWYEARAVDKLDLPTIAASPSPDPFHAITHSFFGPEVPESPVVSHIRLIDVLPAPGLELVLCDMRNGQVLMGAPASGGNSLQWIADVPNPAHFEPVDLDRDGRIDLVVANLGSFLPLDHNLGTVEWLRQTEEGVFERRTLFENLGRVADVRPADLDADGDMDLVVAEFGLHTTGHVLVLKNESMDWEHPRFEVEYLDGRSGAIHVPVVDLDGDGNLDVVALIAQQHEMVNVYLNRGDWRFEARELYRAPGPSWGSSGLQVVDFDRDGDADLLLTNGDTLDDGLLKPYHGVLWLENTGGLTFEPQEIGRCYGAHRAEAVDLDDDGDLDVIACAFMVQDADDVREPANVGLLWFEQLESGSFARHHLETSGLSHPTLHAADFDADGDIDFAVGNAGGLADEARVWGHVWENTLRGSNGE